MPPGSSNSASKKSRATRSPRLTTKLGIPAGTEILLVNPPRGYIALLGRLPKGCQIIKTSSCAVAFLQFFGESRKDLKSAMPGLKRRLHREGMLWVSWPKKASGIDTDLNERLVREIGLDAGLVDVKVCAIDDVWSALKFVYRLKDR